MSLTLNIFSLGLGFFLLGLSVLVFLIGMISQGMLALIAALWFVSFIGNTMFIATYTSGGKS
jgi:hypothetical protein